MRRLSLATALTMALLPGTALAAGPHGVVRTSAHHRRPVHKVSAPLKRRHVVVAHMAGGGHGGSR